MVDNRPAPQVSIVIPMRNEEKYIGACLESILRQDYPRECLEVIVADGQSRDRSRAIVADYARRFPFIRLIDNPRQTPAPGLNAAIRCSTGRLILRMDAHAEYGADYVRQCVRYLALTGAENVGGPLVTLAGADTRMARCIRAITSNRWIVGGSAFRTCMRARYSDGCFFGAWPREVFDQIGFFNEALTRNQDNEFNSRIMRYGGKIFQTPAIRVRYYNQPTLRGLLRQACRNGFWSVLALVANPASFRFRYFAPFGFDLWLVVLALLAPWHSIFLALLLVGLGLYALFLLAVTARIAWSEGWTLLPYVLVAVPAYHVCYGLGSFAGIGRFLIGGRADRECARAGSRIPDPAHPPRLGTRARPVEEVERLSSRSGSDGNGIEAGCGPARRAAHGGDRVRRDGPRAPAPENGTEDSERPA
jgi:glycosyltransferase involved in cell wall biosynthesis